MELRMLVQLALGCALSSALRSIQPEQPLRYTFRQFVAEYNRSYEQGSEHWRMREELFNQRLGEIEQHNSDPRHTWKMGVTKFSDFTEPERKRVLGYRGRGSRRPADEAATAASSLRSFPLPAAFSVFVEVPKLLDLVRDQGNCGSCWAEAATSVLEGQMEVNQTLMAAIAEFKKTSEKITDRPTLSSQTVVSCTNNSRHCGGRGGCSGATVELAYGMVMARGGLPFAIEWTYQSGMNGQTPSCKDDVFNNPRIDMTGFTVLPSNKLNPLKEALVQSGGPIAVSVDATNWFSYVEGVFSDRHFASKGDFTVNHAVTLMGYKNPVNSEQGWWFVKNSWGRYWGESGNIRVEMKHNEEEHCGWDFNTHDGLACDGDPDQAWVCGTCGILYDSVFPQGVHLRY